ncbi:MAG TPA: maleylacetate reductase [Burkholderiaceae bacterium]|jgi:alcohol dehydrogenase class IV|nr:maleylacetate reductase [Burkholderiaceae bacterium]
MQAFVYQAPATRVIFGPGTLARLPEEVARLGATRALVLCTPEQRASAERVAALLGARAAGIFDRATMHVPIESAREARAEAERLGADCAVAIGGGSTTGLGKAIALESGLPIVAVPTTYAGSEMTPIYGLTEGGLKKTGRDERVRPKSVIYDPELTLSLPFAMTVTSAFNAIAHAAEGLYAPDVNPVIALMAEEGIARFYKALALMWTDGPQDLEARGDSLVGAWLCGTVLGATTMGLHHKLCHTLGGSFNLPHAEVHTVMLPHALAYNAKAAEAALWRVGRALGVKGKGDPMSSPRALQDLARLYGAPTSLAELGMPADGLDRAADLAVQNQYANPRPLERAALRALLQRAFDGAPPQP